MSTLLEGVQTSEKHSFQFKYNKICASLPVPQNVALLAALLHEMSLLKKAILELIHKNYRPVSNLEFMGKTIEHEVTSQLTQHISENSLLEPMQSTYRSGHSTKTALLKVKADLLHAIDHQEVVCLILLDLSSAFGTVDHCMLL